MRFLFQRETDYDFFTFEGCAIFDINNHDKHRRMKKICKTQFAAWVILLTCGACSDERIANSSTPGRGENEYEVAFTVRLPSGFAETRGLTSGDEKAINELQVLAFGTDDQLFKFISYAKEVAGTPVGGEKKYVAKLRTGTYDLMVLANSYEYIKDYFPTEIIKDVTPLSSVTKKLRMSVSGKWNTDKGSTGYKAIPFWGVKEAVLVDAQTDLSGENCFDVTRLVAKINVYVDLEENHVGTFDLKSVRYHNRRTQGQLIPNTWDSQGSYIQIPSLVEGDNGIEEALLYDGNSISQDSSCENEIYVFEAPAGARKDHPRYPCLVIGGEYNGHLGYYRIDFSNKVNNAEIHTPILRNHTYNIIITKVDGLGFVDPDDAYHSLPVNMEADIIDWNPNTIGDIYFDGQNYLSIEKGSYELDWKAYPAKTEENTVKIKTDYKDGWKVESIEYDLPGETWLTLEDKSSGMKDEYSERWLQLLANSTRQSRTAVITIAVGRIRGKIIVQQAPAPELGLVVRDADGNVIDDGKVITYYSDNWTSQACGYTLEWFPPNARVQVALVNPVSGYQKMEFDDDSNMLQTSEIVRPSGEYDFDFMIKPFDTSEIKRLGQINLTQKTAIQYQFRVEDSQGGTVTKSFTVVNELRDVQATKLGLCKQGRFYSFDVEYNTPWVLVYNNSEQILDSRTVEGLPENGGIEGQQGKRTIHLRLNMGLNHDGKEASFSFVKPGMGLTNTFDKVGVRSLYNHPNSYIIRPGTSFEFPVAKAYWMGESELVNRPLQGSANDLRVEIIWEDRTDSPVVSNLNVTANTQTPDRSKITGLAGADGNALVALFLNDEIVWSWHLWVTDYHPETDYKWYNNDGIVTQLMDRNLGAWRNELGELRAYGLYYQWGRKDPFPGPSTLEGGGILGAGGNVELEPGPNPMYKVGVAASPASGNLIESIRHPNLFYQPGGAPNDWYTNSTTGYNNALWVDYDQLKSDYDPCPDGWRTANRFWIGNKYYFTWAFRPVDGTNGEGWDYNFGDAPVGRYPTAGYISHENGMYMWGKEECLIWYGCHDVGQTSMDGTGPVRPENKTQGLVDRTYFYQENGGWVNERMRDGGPKANATPIRCERDEERYRPHW